MNDITNHTLIGEVQYAKVHRAQPKYKSEEKEFSVDLVLDAKLEKELTALFNEHNVDLVAFGKSRIKTTADGKKIFKFKRDEVNRNGDLINLEVTAADGQLLPANIAIGNGSKAAVHFIIIQLPNGSGIVRLTGLQVLSLVPYSKATTSQKPMEGQSLEEMLELNAQATTGAVGENSNAPF